METITANLTLASITPFISSKNHQEPVLEGEDRGTYDQRTFRSKLTTAIGPDKKPTVALNAFGFHQALISACKYSKRQIPGQGKATWTAKFQAGIVLMSDIPLGIDPASVDFLDIYVNSDGIRGSGKRVWRRFPFIPSWSASFPVTILDPIITEEIFTEMVELAGMFIGLGAFAPRNGNVNGRFKLDRLEWLDARKIKRAA